MFHVHVIWAQSTSGIIGVNGRLPWHDRGDLQHFKDMTTGRTVVMGRKTRQSLPQRNKKLPNRTNIVLSRTMKSTESIKAVASPYAAIEQTLPGRSVGDRRPRDVPGVRHSPRP